MTFVEFLGIISIVVAVFVSIPGLLCLAAWVAGKFIKSEDSAHKEVVGDEKNIELARAFAHVLTDQILDSPGKHSLDFSVGASEDVLTIRRTQPKIFVSLTNEEVE